MVHCSRCDRYFSGWRALDQHRRDSSFHWVCWECDDDFETWVGLKEHYVQSYRHSYCQYCEEHFDDDDELEEHNQNSHDYCSPCNRVFKDARGLHEHYIRSPRHHYCADCKTLFNSASNLNSHLNSSVHRQKTLVCPMKGCGQRFISPAAVALHLESGSCTSGVDRAELNRLVRQYDKKNLITDPSRLLTNGDQSTSRYYATERAYNQWLGAYECYLCESTFRTLLDLNKHLASPRHEQKIYICRIQSCGARFRALSALCQHVESGKCGALSSGPYKNALEGLMKGMKQLTV